MTTRRCLREIARACRAGVDGVFFPRASTARSSTRAPLGLSHRATSVAGCAACPPTSARAFGSLAPSPLAGLRGDAGAMPPLAHALIWRRGKKKKGGKAAASARADDADDDEDAPTTSAGDDAPAPAYEPEEISALMTAAVEALERDLGKLRTGRAAPGMLESLVVDAYGEPTPLKHVGTVTARNAQTLSVMLYDPGLKSAVSRAIVDSPLGFNPRDDGDALVVPVPEMTAETRREVAKLAGKAGETAKISVRNARKRGWTPSNEQACRRTRRNARRRRSEDARRPRQDRGGSRRREGESHRVGLTSPAPSSQAVAPG